MTERIDPTEWLAIGWRNKRIEDTVAIIRQLLAERGEAVEALRRYGQHKPGCLVIWENGDGVTCTCGLTAAIGGKG